MKLVLYLMVLLCFMDGTIATAASFKRCISKCAPVGNDKKQVSCGITDCCTGACTGCSGDGWLDASQGCCCDALVVGCLVDTTCHNHCTPNCGFNPQQPTQGGCNNGTCLSRRTWRTCRYGTLNAVNSMAFTVSNACTAENNKCDMGVGSLVYYCNCGVANESGSLNHGRAYCECEYLGGTTMKLDEPLRSVVCDKISPRGGSIVKLQPCGLRESMNLTVEYDWVDGVITVPPTGDPAVLVKVKETYAKYGVNLTWEKGSAIPRCNNNWSHCSPRCQGSCPGSSCTQGCTSDTVSYSSPGYEQEMLDLLQNTKSDAGTGSKAHIILANKVINACNCSGCSCTPSCPQSGIGCIAGTEAGIWGIAVANYNNQPGLNPPNSPQQCGAYIFIGQTGLDTDYEREVVIFHELGHLLGLHHCVTKTKCLMHYGVDVGTIQTEEIYLAIRHCQHFQQHGLLTFVDPTTGTRVTDCSVPGTNGEMWFPGHSLVPVSE